MKVQKDWGVFISQTGSELIAISGEIGFLPSLIVTNNLPKISQDNLRFYGEHGITIRTLPFRPTEDNYYMSELLNKRVITLHGFLRILPPAFFTRFKGKIYNGHPGLITEYPELKGKDPQIRAWEGKYPVIGSVVHKVTEGVDEGEVVSLAAVENTTQTLEEMFLILRKTSLEAWKKFFAENWNRT